MKEKEVIKAQLTELLNEYYNGSFVQLVHEYIRLSGLSAKEVQRVLEAIKKEAQLDFVLRSRANEQDGCIREDTTTPGLAEARQKLQYLRMSKKERQDYDRHMDAMMLS